MDQGRVEVQGNWVEHGQRKTSDVLDGSDSEYDTDVDDEKCRETPFDPCGKRTYSRTCRKLRIVPKPNILEALGGAAVDIRRNGLSDNDVLALSTALLDNTTVSKLCLVENPLTEKSFHFLFLALTESLYITTLVLRNTCSTDETCARTCAQLLSETLVENSTIQSVDMSENGLKDIHSVYFASILQNCKTLTHLNLSHNNFGDAGAQQLAAGLAANDTLRSLDLSWNKLQVASTTVVLKALEGHASLKTLNVAMNGLSVAGAVAVARVLAANRILTDMDISSGRIPDAGAVIIGRGLLLNDSLSTLKMSNNPMTSHGALRLLAAIEKNVDSRLRLLDIQSVVVYDDVFATLAKLKTQRSTFRLVCSNSFVTRTAASTFTQCNG